jgi:hypothetical protein
MRTFALIVSCTQDKPGVFEERDKSKSPDDATHSSDNIFRCRGWIVRKDPKYILADFPSINCDLPREDIKRTCADITYSIKCGPVEKLGTVDRAESLKAEIGGCPNPQILAYGASKAMLFDLWVDIIICVSVDV